MIQTLLSLIAVATTPAHGPELRCGWLHNPTPANWWLTDRDGDWSLGSQGGYQAEGMEEMQDMGRRGWVRTNGYYGYGCACLRVTSDRQEQRIITIFSARPVPLRQCQRDRRLPKP